MTTGHFSPDGRSYTITEAPPSPWSHVLADGRFGSVWTERGGAYCWCGNSVLDRLTRWDQDLVLNPSRRYIYLAELPASGSGPSRVLRTLTPSPFPGEATKWEVTYGPGHVTYTGTCARFRTVFTAVVLPGRDAETWHCEVARVGGAGGPVRLFSMQDVLMGTWPDAHREFHKLFIHTSWHEGSPADSALRAVAAIKRLDTRPGVEEHWNCDFPGVLIHAGTAPAVRGFETDRLAFFGYAGDPASPATLASAPRNGSTGCWGDACLGLDIVLEMAGGHGATTLVTAWAPDMDAALASSAEALTISREDAIKTAEAWWADQVGPVAVKSPSADLDPMVSHWLRYQAIAGRIYARCGLYQASGAYGFRDQLQDSMLFLHYKPERTLEQLKLHLAHQFKNGEVLHWWHPGIDIGPRKKCSDNFLWPILASAELFRETGSAKFLRDKVKFMDAGEKSIWDHLNKSVDLAWERRSPRGLPLLGECDWNDGLSSAGDKGRGESVWVGHFYHVLLLEMATMAEALGKDPKPYVEKAAAIREAVNAHGWDGGWYMQGTNDEGVLIGSNSVAEGKIHLNAQTWSVIGATAAELANGRTVTGYTDRARQAMQAVKDRLVVDWGVLLLSPAYATPDSSLGYITRYAPGARENGGVYTHGAVWTIRAARMMGDAELARKVAFSLLPTVRGRDPRYRCEPYVTPGNIDGPTTPTPGKGGWTWYTGSASWLVRCLVDDVLGVRASDGGLTFDPLVPTDWPGFSLTRPWRGRLLNIEAKRGSAAGIVIRAGKGKPVEIAGSQLTVADLPRGTELNVQVTYK